MADDPKPSATDQRRAERNGYFIKTWGPEGRKTTVYQCDTCPYDSTDEAKVAAHVQTMGHQGD